MGLTVSEKCAEQKRISFKGAQAMGGGCLVLNSNSTFYVRELGQIAYLSTLHVASHTLAWYYHFSMVIWKCRRIIIRLPTQGYLQI